MAGSRSLWRTLIKSGCAVIVTSVLSAGPAVMPAQAQEGAAHILTLDQDRLFVESAFGRASVERERVAGEALEAENAAIEAELVSEEQDLTARRQTTDKDEFSALATAFDQKVETIRKAQDAKARDLGRAREADQQTFREAVIPLLGKLMNDKGAVAIIDRASVIQSSPAIDVTDEAIVRIDATLGPGEIVAPAAKPAEPANQPFGPTQPPGSPAAP